MTTHTPYLPGTDMPRFIRELSDFVGLGDTDIAVIRGTAHLVLEAEAEFTAALYEHFMKFPATARFFLDESGVPDRARLERRKHSLGRWLRLTAEAAATHEFSYYSLAVGLSHSHRAQGPGGVVPAHFMVATMSIAQTTLAQLFHTRLGDAADALAASTAWNKLLLVQLNVLLLGYLPPRPA